LRNSANGSNFQKILGNGATLRSVFLCFLLSQSDQSKNLSRACSSTATNCMSLRSLRDSQRFSQRYVSSLHLHVERLKHGCQARANKSKDKPDSELDEFDKVKDESHMQHTFCNSDALFVVVRSLKNIGCKEKKTKPSRSASERRRQLPRNARQGRVRIQHPSKSPSNSPIDSTHQKACPRRRLGLLISCFATTITKKCTREISMCVNLYSS